MDTQHIPAARALASAGVASASLEAGDELQSAEARYCPTRMLANFALLMAGHGRCVSTTMMLGDREYAMWQLACARGMDDAELQLVARRLFAYFDDAQHSGMPVLGTA
jgi:hypothetical protein